MAMIMCSVIYRDFSWGPKFQEAQFLSRALTCGHQVDQSFYILEQIERIREELSGQQQGRQKQGGSAAGGGQVQSVARLTAIDRVLVEQKQREIASLEIEAKRAAVALWDIVGDRNPDLASLQTASVDTTEADRRLRDLFEELLGLIPTSSSLLRQYAGYLQSSGRGADQRVQDLLSKADRLDESSSHRIHKVERAFVFGQRLAEPL